MNCGAANLPKKVRREYKERSEIGEKDRDQHGREKASDTAKVECGKAKFASRYVPQQYPRNEKSTNNKEYVDADKAPIHTREFQMKQDDSHHGNRAHTINIRAVIMWFNISHNITLSASEEGRAVV